MGADPNKVRVSGENSFMRIGESEDADPTAEMSHWRVVASPKGVGHILFAKSVLSNGEPRIYSDNFALARWLQEGVQASMRDTYSGDIPIIDAEFSKSGDMLTCWVERVDSHDEEIVLVWSDFIAPVQVANQPFDNPEQPHGVYSLLIPARRAQLTINGNTAPGRVLSKDLFGREGTSCCLALSETWTIPPDHEWAQDAL
jgi:hypothetical protein